jgi:elongation factor G
LGAALNRLAEEDASLHVSVDRESGQTVIKGMSEHHLERAVDRLKRDFNVAANVGAPQVAYRETIIRTIEHNYTHKRQTFGQGEFAKVTMRFEPLPAGSDFVFARGDACSLPPDYVSGVEQGVRNAMECGPLAGFPMVDFKATLIGGQYHDEDSNVMTFETAARACFREAVPRAGPRILEPIMKVEVRTPEDCLGSVIGDLNSRRGHMIGFDSREDACAVTALVPLANMFGYVNTLRSMSQGRALHSMQFDHYEQVPNSPPDGPDNFPGAMALR